jgi:hypothetical protein
MWRTIVVILVFVFLGCEFRKDLCITHQRILSEQNKDELRQLARQHVAPWGPGGFMRREGIAPPSCPECRQLIEDMFAHRD